MCAHQISLDDLQIQPLEPNSPVPLYYQVEAHLRALLQSDNVAAGDLLPTEMELASAYKVGRHTIRTALGRLVNDGLIVRKAGHGTIVRVQEERRQFSLAWSFSRQIEELGMKPSSQVLQQETRTILPSDPRQLTSRNLGALMMILERLRFGNDEPIGLQCSYVLLKRCPGLKATDFEHHSLYDVLSNQYRLRITEITHTVTATIADKRQADLLRVEPRAPLLVVNSCSLLEAGELIEYGVTYYRADKYEYTTTQTSK